MAIRPPRKSWDVKGNQPGTVDALSASRIAVSTPCDYPPRTGYEHRSHGPCAHLGVAVPVTPGALAEHPVSSISLLGSIVDWLVRTPHTQTPHYTTHTQRLKLDVSAAFGACFGSADETIVINSCQCGKINKYKMVEHQVNEMSEISLANTPVIWTQASTPHARCYAALCIRSIAEASGMQKRASLELINHTTTRSG